MIGYLRGKVLDRRAPHLLLDVGGVGYEVEATMSTFYAMPAVGNEFSLFTHLVVREDAQLLYGFASEVERTFFRALIKINGVGAKLALTILSGMAVDDFVRCIHESDAATLTRLPGVGKKKAERLIIEMRDRIEGLVDGGASSASTVASSSVAAATASDPVADAVSALMALGYKPPEAGRMVRGLSCEGKDSETLIREALQSIVA